MQMGKETSLQSARSRVSEPLSTVSLTFLATLATASPIFLSMQTWVFGSQPSGRSATHKGGSVRRQCVLEPSAQHSRSRGDRRHPVQVLSPRGGAKGAGSSARTAAQPIVTPGYDPGRGGASAPPARTNQRATPPARSGTKGGTALCGVGKASALGAGPCIFLCRMLLQAGFYFVFNSTDEPGSADRGTLENAKKR